MNIVYNLIVCLAECDGTPSEEYIPEVSNEPVYDFPEPPPAIQPLFQPCIDGKPIGKSA